MLIGPAITGEEEPSAEDFQKRGGSRDRSFNPGRAMAEAIIRRISDLLDDLPKDRKSWAVAGGLHKLKKTVSALRSVVRDAEKRLLDDFMDQQFMVDQTPGRNLRVCFVFCSLFPEDSVIDKLMLTSLWMAEGFIRPIDNVDWDMEDIAHDYFMDLLRRNFFHDCIEDEFGNVTSCKMHGCKNLQPLGALTSLKRLEIGALPIMEYTESDLHTLSSLPNLSALRKWESPNLERIPPLLQLKLPSFPLESLQTSVATIEHVIGIDDRVKDVIKLLEIEGDGGKARMVGIGGTAGIGKTTIAKVVYNQLSSRFDSCSFLAKIGETAQNVGGIQFVQTKLISDILKRDGNIASLKRVIKFFLDVFRSIKVLIVLDDVEEQSHLSDLVGDQLDCKIGEDNMLWMHKLLKCLSRTIDQEEPRYTVMHSILYMDGTDLTVINWKEGLEEVEALCFDFKNRPLHLPKFGDPDSRAMLSVGPFRSFSRWSQKLLCLNLKSCTELNMLPDELGGLESLKEILIDGTSVEEIPLEGDLKKLETLCASNCLSLSLLPAHSNT
ncbi:hypothetical protein NL676_008246 [Syzygium grande]|nr:hypothetical protein NL676_008246 [Syzygium grande]